MKFLILFKHQQVSTTYGWQSVNTQQKYVYKQSSYGDAPTYNQQGDSSVLDKECLQSLLIAKEMFHQPTGIKHAQNITGLEESLSDYTKVDNMDENNKFVCTECSKSIITIIIKYV